MFLLKRFLVVTGLVFTLNHAAYAEDEASAIQIIELNETSTVSTPALEPVQSRSLKLLGAGVAARDSSESLALACTEEFSDQDGTHCSVARFVYFKNESEAYYIGTNLEIPSAQNQLSEKQKVKALKKALKDYFSTRQTSADVTKKKVKALFLAGVGVVACYVVFAAAPVTTIAVAFKGTGAFMVPLLLAVHHDTYGFVDKGLVEVQMTDQHGWNWSSKPKMIGKNHFRRIMKRLSLY